MEDLWGEVLTEIWEMLFFKPELACGIISGSWIIGSPIWCDLYALPGRTDGVWEAWSRPHQRRRDPPSCFFTRLLDAKGPVGALSSSSWWELLVCLGSVGMRGLGTSLSLKKNAVVSSTSNSGDCVGGSRTRKVRWRLQLTTPPLMRGRRQGCLVFALQAGCRRALSQLLLISMGRQINSITSIRQEEEALLE